MHTSPERPMSAGDIARRRAASRDLWPGITVLLVSQATLLAMDPDASDGGWKLAWALSPVVGILLLVWAQARSLARSDERERAVELTAMSVGFGVVITALAVVGVLQGADLGDARQQVQITTGLGVVSWVLASQVLTRRAA